MVGLLIGLVNSVESAADINVTLTTPTDASTATTTTIAFTCSAVNGTGTEYNNITIYSDYSGTWTNLSTNSSVVASGDGITWTSGTLTDFESANWSCYACNSSGECSWASSNFTITQDDTAPTVSSCTPSTSKKKSFTISCVTNDATSICRWGKIDTSYGALTNAFDTVSTTTNTDATVLPDGTHKLYVRCKDDHDNQKASSFGHTVSLKSSKSSKVTIGADGQINIPSLEHISEKESAGFSGVVTWFGNLIQKMINFFR